MTCLNGAFCWDLFNLTLAWTEIKSNFISKIVTQSKVLTSRNCQRFWLQKKAREEEEKRIAEAILERRKQEEENERKARFRIVLNDSIFVHFYSVWKIRQKKNC